MKQTITAGILLVALSLVCLEIVSTRAQFMSFPTRRKQQAMNDFIKEILELDLPLFHKNEVANKRHDGGGRLIKPAVHSLQGRMVTEQGGGDQSEMDLNCETDLRVGNLQVDLKTNSYSSRIECLNRNRHLANEDHILKMQAKLEKLIDYLNARRVAQARKANQGEHKNLN